MEARTARCKADHDVGVAAVEPLEGERGDCGPHVEGLPDGSFNVLPLHVRGVFYPGSWGKNITLEQRDTCVLLMMPFAVKDERKLILTVLPT